KGEYVAPTKLTLREFLLEEWPRSRKQRRPSTIATYDYQTRKHIVPKLGHHRLQALRPSHVNAFLGELESAGLSAETRRLIYSVLRKALNDAVRWDMLTRNPLERVDRPEGDSRRKVTAWTARELQRFVTQVKDERLFALWRLGATTGMRRGELLGL